MMRRERLLRVVWGLVLCMGLRPVGQAQNDTLKPFRLDSFLLKQKGLVGELAQSLLADTAVTPEGFQRVDQPFQRFRGRVIRRITVRSLNFGVSIGDTTRVLNNRLTRLVNRLHRNTREGAIRDNLFFREGDRLSPFLLGDNERYLRDLPYLQNARITVRPVKGSPDSVDVTVLTKDVISIGGDAELHDTRSASLTVKEDNFMGLGDRLQLQALYDRQRHERFGFGGEYIRRNIGGSFMDAAAGYVNFAEAFSSGRSEERSAYLRLVKPLAHPYMRWTYALEARLGATHNMYADDSFYLARIRYKTHVVDAWGTFNFSAGPIGGKNEDNRLRLAASARFLHQRFTEKPLHYNGQYHYRYADGTALLGGLLLFQQNFYEVPYLYGFGRPEDVPQGVEASLALGWTEKEGRQRPYAGLGFQRFYFTSAGRYLNFTLRGESFFHKGSPEDVTLQGRVEFINQLHHITGRWKQRTFVNAAMVRQFRGLLSEPVFPDGLYGRMDDHWNEPVGGDWRASLGAESVFYSPWSVAYFRLAPLAFGDLSLFRYQLDHTESVKLYPAVGAGLRARNESLILGTMELKAWYFPRKNFYGDQFKFGFRTRVRLTYDQKLIRRPEFVVVN